MTARLELIDVTKTYPGCVANDRVSLRIQPGEIHAVLGENGAGKSTLMKMIYGVVAPDSGAVIWEGREVTVEGPAYARRLGMGMVFQHFQLFETLTVAENVQLSLPAGSGGTRAVEDRIRASGREWELDIDPRRRVGELSVGEQQRVEILRCLLQQPVPRLLILDEPTSVLTPGEVGHFVALLKRLADSGVSILFISHKLNEVRELCQTATILRAGRVTGTCDPTRTSALDIARLMLGDTLDLTDSFAAGKPGAARMRLVDVGTKTLSSFACALDAVNLTLHAGEIVGIAGVAGNGQDELIALLNGETAPDTGRITALDPEMEMAGSGPGAHRRRGIHVVPAERLGRAAIADLNLAENELLTSYLGSSNHGFIDWRARAATTRELIERHRVKAGGPDALAGSLSGGNLQKFIIGREVDQQPRVLACQHPTWGVDVGAADKIRGLFVALRDAGAAVLVISEDLDELYLVADRLGALCHGRLSSVLPKALVARERLGQWMTGDFAA